jgi:hypothetical protein
MGPEENQSRKRHFSWRTIEKGKKSYFPLLQMKKPCDTLMELFI